MLLLCSDIVKTNEETMTKLSSLLSESLEEAKGSSEIGSSTTMTGIGDVIKAYYAGETKELKPSGLGRWTVHRANGEQIPNVVVELSKGRLRFRRISSGPWTIKLTDSQVMVMEIYIFDPAHDGWDDPFPGEMKGNTLTVTDKELAYRLLSDVANAEEKDRVVSGSALALARKILKL